MPIYLSCPLQKKIRKKYGNYFQILPLRHCTLYAMEIPTCRPFSGGGRATLLLQSSAGTNDLLYGATVDLEGNYRSGEKLGKISSRLL